MAESLSALSKQVLLSLLVGPALKVPAEQALRMSAVIANFYAPWCQWCRRLEPTWEAVREEVHAKYPDTDGRIHLAKVPARTPATENSLHRRILN